MGRIVTADTPEVHQTRYVPEGVLPTLDYLRHLACYVIHKGNSTFMFQEGSRAHYACISTIKFPTEHVHYCSMWVGVEDCEDIAGVGTAW